MAGRRDGEGNAELDAALGALETALEDGELIEANRHLERARELASEDDPIIAFYEASVAWETSGPDAAVEAFDRALALDAEFSDAHHGLALAHEARDDRQSMVRHFLRTLELDAADDARDGLGRSGEVTRLQEMAAAVIDGIPEPFRGRLQNVPIVIEDRPHRSLVEDGFDPRSLGLFEGAPDGAVEVLDVLPQRIVLYSHNLLASFPDDDDLVEQVEITILHEVGHYFGLDEEQVAKLGLE